MAQNHLSQILSVEESANPFLVKIRVLVVSQSVRPRRVKILRFFPPSSAPFSLFLSFSGGLLVDFWWCFEGPVLECARLEFSGCRGEALAAPKAAGVSHDNPRAQTCTFEGPRLRKHHQNSTSRHPERE